MSNVQNTTALVETSRQGPDTPLAHRRPRYPLASCFPAEPAAVSLGRGIAPKHDCNFQPLDIGVMPQKIHLPMRRALVSDEPILLIAMAQISCRSWSMNSGFLKRVPLGASRRLFASDIDITPQRRWLAPFRSKSLRPKMLLSWQEITAHDHQRIGN